MTLKGLTEADAGPPVMISPWETLANEDPYCILLQNVKFGYSQWSRDTKLSDGAEGICFDSSLSVVS